MTIHFRGVCGRAGTGRPGAGKAAPVLSSAEAAQSASGCEIPRHRMLRHQVVPHTIPRHQIL